MNDEDREKYLHTKDLNTHLLAKLADGHAQLEKLLAQKSELEDDLSTSQVELFAYDPTALK